MNADQRKRLAALDSRDFDVFAKEYGPTLDEELLDWIKLIIPADTPLRSFKRLYMLAWYIFVELQGVAFGQPEQFHVGSKTAEFQKFIYHFDVFSTIGVPYKRWSSVAEQMLVALMETVDSGRINLNSPKCKAAKKYASDVLADLTKDEEIGQRFTDLLNGAL